MKSNSIIAAMVICSSIEWMTGTAIALDATPPKLRAFPGAEGWGAVAVGGRSGRVIKVTNLKPNGPGSLAEACSAEGPRIVVFDVSGVIRGNIRITQPHITIAGQTAPGAGVTIEGMISSYDHGVHDIIIRNLRVRRKRDKGSGGDCIQLGGLGPTKTGTYNIILDHLSLSWGNDEIIDLYHHTTSQFSGAQLRSLMIRVTTKGRIISELFQRQKGMVLFLCIIIFGPITRGGFLVWHLIEKMQPMIFATTSFTTAGVDTQMTGTGQKHVAQ